MSTKYIIKSFKPIFQKRQILGCYNVLLEYKSNKFSKCKMLRIHLKGRQIIKVH